MNIQEFINKFEDVFDDVGSDFNSFLRIFHRRGVYWRVKLFLS